MMTKKERHKILKAISLFLDADPDRWVDGMDELYLLVHGKKWSTHMHSGKPVDVRDLLVAVKDDKGRWVEGRVE